VDKLSTAGKRPLATWSSGDHRREVDNGWSERSDWLERGLPRVGPYPASGLARRVRRLADLSQRQLAQRCGLSRSTVARIESGELTPSLEVLQRILAVADVYLVAVEDSGRVVRPDPGGGRYPDDLAVIVEGEPGVWWADEYGLARPPESFTRSRELRDARRELSQYELRPKLYRWRTKPEISSRAEIEARMRGEPWPPRPARLSEPEQIDSNEWDVDEWDGDT
jgi:transcriptional regulator with XRE-family HTH domain